MSVDVTLEVECKIFQYLQRDMIPNHGLLVTKTWIFKAKGVLNFPYISFLRRFGNIWQGKNGSKIEYIIRYIPLITEDKYDKCESKKGRIIQQEGIISTSLGYDLLFRICSGVSFVLERCNPHHVNLTFLQQFGLHSNRNVGHLIYLDKLGWAAKSNAISGVLACWQVYIESTGGIRRIETHHQFVYTTMTPWTKF